jgi:hypothetical protein
MTLKFPAAKTLAMLFATVAVIATAVAVSPADAQTTTTKRKTTRVYDRDAAYGARGPNVSYQQGRTRVYVTRRSWLDAGVEVLPGDRKFTDYAYPPGYSFARDNLNRPLDRQPLNSQWDLGGYPERFPLY